MVVTGGREWEEEGRGGRGKRRKGSEGGREGERKKGRTKCFAS